MELLLDEALDDSVEVTSAGTMGMPSWPISPPMGELLLANYPALDTATSRSMTKVPSDMTGNVKAPAQDAENFRAKVEEFRSRPLTEKLVGEADLILTATGAHRSEVLALNPLALRRTMSLGELARLAQVVDKSAWADKATDAERLKALVPLALAARSAAPTDDIEDPYKRPDEIYVRSLGQITGHINSLVSALHQ